eukprot:165230_1
MSLGVFNNLLNRNNLISHYTLLLHIVVIACCKSNFTLLNYTLPESYYQHAMGVYNNIVTVMRYGSYTHSIHLLFSDNWAKTLMSSPKEITRFNVFQGSVQVNNEVYIINPHVQSGNAKTGAEMFIYDLVSNTYSVSTPPSQNGYDGCAVYDKQDSIYYVAGVMNDNLLANTQMYHISNNTWSEKAPINLPRRYSACAMNSNYSLIYLFGGWDGSRLSDIQRYTVSSNQWLTLPETLSVDRHSHTCRLLSLDNRIYCVGGLSGGAVTNSVEIFDPATEKIVNTIYMQFARQSHQSIVIGNNCLFVSGGLGRLPGEDAHDVYTSEYIGSCITTIETPTLNPILNSSVNSTTNLTFTTSFDQTYPQTTLPATAEPTDTITSNVIKQQISMGKYLLQTVIALGILDFIIFICCIYYIFTKLKNRAQDPHNTSWYDALKEFRFMEYFSIVLEMVDIITDYIFAADLIVSPSSDTSLIAMG